jgi:hypothetical protein
MKNIKKSSTQKNKGKVVYESGGFFFKSIDGELLQDEIGYMRNRNDSKKMLKSSLMDYYPITEFFLQRLVDENTICELEIKDGQIYKINDKIVIII